MQGGSAPGGGHAGGAPSVGPGAPGTPATSGHAGGTSGTRAPGTPVASQQAPGAGVANTTGAGSSTGGAVTSINQGSPTAALASSSPVHDVIRSNAAPVRYAASTSGTAVFNDVLDMYGQLAGNDPTAAGQSRVRWLEEYFEARLRGNQPAAPTPTTTGFPQGTPTGPAAPVDQASPATQATPAAPTTQAPPAPSQAIPPSSHPTSRAIVDTGSPPTPAVKPSKKLAASHPAASTPAASPSVAPPSARQGQAWLNGDLLLAWAKDETGFQESLLSPEERFSLYEKSLRALDKVSSALQRGDVDPREYRELARRLRQFHESFDRVENFLDDARVKFTEAWKILSQQRPDIGLPDGTLPRRRQAGGTASQTAVVVEQVPEDLCDVARQLGHAIATREAARFRRRRRGQLDLRRLFRRNLRHGGTPVQLAFRRKRLVKPKLVILCDVSGSVDAYIPFFLSFFHEFNQVYSRIRTFVFVDTVVEITRDIEQGSGDFDERLAGILNRPEIHKNNCSKFGQVFHDFRASYLDALGPHTILVIAGDARNNYYPEHLRDFHEISRAAHQTIWLNPLPEQEWEWYSGIMSHYAPSCDHVFHASRPEHLLQVVAARPFDMRRRGARDIRYVPFPQKTK